MTPGLTKVLGTSDFLLEPFLLEHGYYVLNMELSHPFIRLPFSFDANRLKQELAVFEDSVWMEHPNRINGNSAIPLISLNGEDNNGFSGQMQPTTHLARCDYVKQVMASFGEVLARSRFMKLAAGEEVTEHVDFNYHWYDRVRIHIPITTYPDVQFYCGDQQIHMQAGECWIFDSWRRHKVLNNSQFDRTHLVIDLAGSSRFWNTVERMSAFASDFRSAEFEAQVQHKSFEKAQENTLKVEKYNVSPVMAPGELEAIARELINDVAANPENNSAMVQEYRQLLRGLAKDWRETWLQFGFETDGIEHYRSLLNRTVKQLRPNPRVLVTASNDVGINPIIMQRILRAALNVEQLT